MYCMVDRELETKNSGQEPKRLSLMRLSFKGQIVQRDCNNHECNEYLETVKKFIQACHRFSDGSRLPSVLSVYKKYGYCQPKPILYENIAGN